MCLTRELQVSRAKWLIVLWPIGLLLFIFWEPLTTSRTLFHPDWAPYFEKGNGPGFYEMFVNMGRPLSPMYLLWAMLPSRLFHLLFYPLMVLGIFGFMYIFLRDQALPRLACVLGALSLSFSGYVLTLVAAGHRGVFEAVLSAVLALLCIDRAIRGRSLVYFMLAPVAVSLSLGTQPDVLAMIGVFIGVYALVAAVRYRESINTNRLRFLVGCALGALALTICAAPGLIKIKDVYLPNRQTIEEREIADADVQSVSGRKGIPKKAKWEFCTNWSLPLADLPELVVPLVFGTQSNDRKAPFWGELGRSLGWEPGKPGFRNFRQHTVYLGCIQVLLALFSLICFFTNPKKKDLASDFENRWHIPFWALCAVIGLLLTMGRYTPFYRLFFILPLADTIRCPVKFLHVTSLSVSILSAYGLGYMLNESGEKNESSSEQDATIGKRRLRFLVILCAAVLALLLLVLVAVRLSQPAFTQYWTQIGYPQDLHAVMLDQMMLALLRAAGLTLVVGGAAFWLMRPGRVTWQPVAVGVILCALVGVDMATVGKRFVQTIDLSVHESRNDAVLDMKQGRDYAPRVLDLLTSRGPHDPLRVNLKYYYAADIRLLDDELGAGSPLLQQGLSDGTKLARMLVATGTEFVLGRREQISQWAASPEFELVGRYDFAGRIVRSARPSQAPIVLLRVVNALPRVAVFGDALAVTSEERFNQVFSNAWDPQTSILVQTSVDELPAPSNTLDSATIGVAELEEPSRWKVKVKAVVNADGFLLLNEVFDSDWKAVVDGRATSIIRVNGNMMAIRLPEGEHHVSFRLIRVKPVFWLKIFLLLILTICLVSLALQNCNKN
jgi:hypothetical protein